jgi:hypothetical protein
VPVNALAIKLDYDVRVIRSVPINFAVPCLHRESRPRAAPRLYSFTVSVPFRVPVPTLGIVLSYWYAYARRHGGPRGWDLNSDRRIPSCLPGAGICTRIAGFPARGWDLNSDRRIQRPDSLPCLSVVVTS